MEDCKCNVLDERQRLTDLLSGEKFLAGVYNTYRSEAATDSVRRCLATLLEDEHRMGETLFNEMNTRGWYPVERAQETKLQAAKQKFTAAASK
ncbi:MAG: spore coat protein [Ruminococcaceae bacterium]|nr:spore coat protein [Oscillospiraceae bacterium]